MKRRSIILTILSILLVFGVGCFLFLLNQNEEVIYSYPQSGWGVYLSTTNGKTSSIVFEEHYKPIAPIDSAPYLARINVSLRNPLEDGLCTPEESSTLLEIENALTRELCDLRGWHHVGNITSDSKRDYIFYFTKKGEEVNAIAKAMAMFPDYPYKLEVKEEKDWSTYLKILYPDAKNLQLSYNVKLIHEFIKAGEDLNTPREVDHLTLFKTEKDCAKFTKEIEALGFEVKSAIIVDEPENSDGYIHSVYLTRVDKINIKEVDKFTMQVLETASKFDGKYEGWGFLHTK